VIGEEDVAGIQAVVTEVEGARFVPASTSSPRPDDPLGDGFLLR
jgi:hypothetical protein